MDWNLTFPEFCRIFVAIYLATAAMVFWLIAWQEGSGGRRWDREPERFVRAVLVSLLWPRLYFEVRK